MGGAGSPRCDFTGKRALVANVAAAAGSCFNGGLSNIGLRLAVCSQYQENNAPGVASSAISRRATDEFTRAGSCSHPLRMSFDDAVRGKSANVVTACLTVERAPQVRTSGTFGKAADIGAAGTAGAGAQRESWRRG